MEDGIKAIQLGNKTLNFSSAPYIIAEIGVNHEGSISQAKKLIDLAKEGGADAAKFQTYKAETIASRYSPSYWDLSKESTTSQFKLFKKYDAFGQKEYEELAEYCLKAGIDFLSTPFDDAAVDFLDPLMPFFKIASADITNLPFVRKIAEKGKTVVLSTGASNIAEINQAVDTLESAGCPEVILLHCILNYPTSNENAHLGMISGLRQVFPDKQIGYSDHTLPDATMTPLIAAYISGARVLEKHFTHDKTLPGNDHYHAMDVDDLKRFHKQLETVSALMGPAIYKHPIETEEISRKNARRSIVLAQDVPPGIPLTAEMLTYKRPGTGISPDEWDSVLGKTVSQYLEADHVLQWSDIETAKVLEFAG